MALFALWRDDIAAEPAHRLHARLAAESHLAPERTTALAIETPVGRWHLAAFACATRFLQAEAQVWSAPGQGACVVHGVAWHRDAPRPEPLDAAAIAARLDGREAIPPADLAGEYAVARLFPDGRLLAFSDVAGVHQLFHRPDLPHMVASRAAFLAALVDDWTPEPEAGLWLATVGYRVGQASGWRGVQQVPQAHALTAGHGPVPMPSPDRCDGPRGFLHGGEALLEQGRAQAVAAIRLAAGDDPVELPVTGGKDSRAVLALALQAGLRDRLTLVTRGPADHPDVRVAGMIAASLGLPHRREPPRIEAEPDVARFVAQLAAHTYQTDGGMGGWDLLVGDRLGRSTMLTGHMGEVLKTHRKRPVDAAVPTDMVRQQAPFDPLGLLRPAARATLDQQLADAGAAMADAGATVDDHPDLFYYRNRVPNWLGGIRGVRAHERQPVMPLGVPALQQLAFRITADERAAELIHYRLIRDSAPELLALPFAHQSWSPALDAPHVPPLLAHAGAALFGNWQWTLNHDAALRAWLSAFFARIDIPLWEALDSTLLLEQLRDRRLDYAEAIATLGLIAAAFHQSGTVHPARIGGDAPACPIARPIAAAMETEAAGDSAVIGYVDLIAGVDREEGERIAPTLGKQVTVQGWAAASAWPGIAPAVEARADGAVIATVRPDRDRPDLRVLGLPHTRYGFILAFEAAALAGTAELTIACGHTILARYAVAHARMPA